MSATAHGDAAFLRAEGWLTIADRLDAIEAERDEALAEVERLRGELWQAQHDEDGQLEWCRSELAEARAETDRLRVALSAIRSDHGKVCDQFEICDHVACQSSAAAWFIADEALGEASPEPGRGQ